MNTFHPPPSADSLSLRCLRPTRISPTFFPVSPTFFFYFARKGCNFAAKNLRDEEESLFCIDSQLSSERLALRQQEVAAAQRAYEVSKDVMQNSSSTYLEVLTAQQSLLQSRLSLTADRFDLIQGKINLFKALGGEIGSK